MAIRIRTWDAGPMSELSVKQLLQGVSIPTQSSTSSLAMCKAMENPGSRWQSLRPCGKPPGADFAAKLSTMAPLYTPAASERVFPSAAAACARTQLSLNCKFSDATQ